MQKMKLPARVPNLGAHKLAWIIGSSEDQASEIASLTAALGGNPFVVERILRGEIVPAAILASQITCWSQWMIGRRDWRRPVHAAWTAQPYGWCKPHLRAA